MSHIVHLPMFVGSGERSFWDVGPVHPFVRYSVYLVLMLGQLCTGVYNRV